MRIGKFSEKYNVSIDTIRYYVDLGLLTPQKKNHYYDFNELCEEDMTLIKELKQFHFSLQEIHNILAFKRVTLFIEKEDVNYFIEVLKGKQDELVQKKEEISSAIQLIKEKIQKLHQSQLIEKSFSGVPLDFVSLFACPLCRTNLSLKETTINQQHISFGKLFCTCGFQAIIDDGILLTKHLNEVSYNSFYLYDREMFKIMNTSFISLSERCGLWIKDRLLSKDIKGKVIMETHVDTYVFLHKYINDLENDALYIFCGSTIEMLKDLRAKVQKANPELKVLYVLNSGMDLPLKQNSIDFLIDSYSFNEYALFHNALPMDSLSPYLNVEGKVIGCSFYYQKHTNSLKHMKKFYPNGMALNLTSAFIQKNLQSNNFDFLVTKEIGHTTNTGKYFKYHSPGDKATFFVYEGGEKKGSRN